MGEDKQLKLSLTELCFVNNELCIVLFYCIRFHLIFYASQVISAHTLPLSVLFPDTQNFALPIPNTPSIIAAFPGSVDLMPAHRDILCAEAEYVAK
jgi:hypothetical protein